MKSCYVVMTCDCVQAQGCGFRRQLATHERQVTSETDEGRQALGHNIRGYRGQPRTCATGGGVRCMTSGRGSFY